MPLPLEIQTFLDRFYMSRIGITRVFSYVRNSNVDWSASSTDEPREKRKQGFRRHHQS